MQTFTKHTLIVGLACALAACGGGGSSPPAPVDNLLSGAPPTPLPNRAPTLESPNDAETLENDTSAAYTVRTADADGDTVSVSLGGPDARLLRLDAATGELFLRTAPDYEIPDDADRDGIYRIELSLTDGEATTREAVSITVLDRETETRQRYVDDLFEAELLAGSVPFRDNRLFLDVFGPAGETSDLPRPLIIFASGGGMITQTRKRIEPLAIAFAERGYVTATMDYGTLGRQSRGPDEFILAATKAMIDMRGAVAFLRDQADTYGIDPDRVFVGGSSAGGVMALNVAALDREDAVQTPVIRDYLAGVGGLDEATLDFGQSRGDVQGAMSLAGAMLELDLIDADDAPVFAAHHEYDNIVPCDTASEGSSSAAVVVTGSCGAVPAFQAAGVEAELYLVEGSTSHAIFTDAQIDDIVRGASELFFRTTIARR